MDGLEEKRADAYSVLMSVYAKEKPEYLKLSLSSMFNQTIAPYEVVLVKDGTLTPALEEILQEFQQTFSNQLKIIALEKNMGLGYALAAGIQQCTCEFIARMDTDDIALPQRCQIQLDQLRKGLDIVGCYVDEFVGDPSNVISRREVPITHEKILAFARRRSPFNHPTVMYRKSKVISCGNYPPWPKFQDYGLFSQMLAKGCMTGNVDQSLVLMRVDNMHTKRTNSLALQYFIKSRLHAHRLGIAGFWDVAAGIAVQLALYVLPVSVSKRFYARFLRKRA